MIYEKFDPSGSVSVEPFLASLAGGSDGGGCCAGCVLQEVAAAQRSPGWSGLSLRDGLPLSGGDLLMGTMLRKLYKCLVSGTAGDGTFLG